MNFAFDTKPVIERLRQRATTLQLVETSAGVDAAFKNTTGPTPAAFVVLSAERSSPRVGGAGGRFIQQATTYVSVILRVRDYGAENLGSGAVDALVPVRRAVGAALLGWMPPDCELVFDHDSGRLESYSSGLLWWQDIFRTRYVNTVNK